MTYVGNVLSKTGQDATVILSGAARVGFQRSTPDSVQMLPVVFLIINISRRPLTSISETPTSGSIRRPGELKDVIWNGSPTGVARNGSIRTPQRLK